MASDNILIVAPAWVGDMVMTSSLLQRLKANDARCTITVAAPPATLPVTERMPEVDHRLTWPFAHGAFAFAARRALGRRLRAQHFTWAIVLPNSWKSALVPWFSGIARRTGYVGEFRHGLLNDARRLDDQALPLMVQRFVALADASDTPLADFAAPRLIADEGSRSELIARLGLTLTRPVLALCPGAEYGPAKQWPASHFAALAGQHVRRGYAVWIFGSPKDRAIAAEIAALVSAEIAAPMSEQIARKSAPESGTEPDVPVVDLTGKTSLPHAIDLLSCAARVVSNDSGLMHVAAALARPVVGIYGSTTPGFTPPLGERTAAVSLNIACSPCFDRECRFGHYDCLRLLDETRVLSALETVEAAPGNRAAGGDGSLAER